MDQHDEPPVTVERLLAAYDDTDIDDDEWFAILRSASPEVFFEFDATVDARHDG